MRCFNSPKSKGGIFLAPGLFTGLSPPAKPSLPAQVAGHTEPGHGHQRHSRYIIFGFERFYFLNHLFDPLIFFWHDPFGIEH